MKKSLIFKIFAAMLALVMCFGLAACGGSDTDADNTDTNIGGEADGTSPELNGEPAKVKFTMTSEGKPLGEFIVELYPEYAPITVANFLKLVNEGFYNGVGFHRVYEGFMAQGGDPDGDGRSDGTETTIKGEFASNGVVNNLSHTRGVISMARTKDPNSASTQFFICYSDDYTGSLDGGYAAFGKVIEGMEVVDSFLDIPREYNGERVPTKPVKDITMQSVVVVE